MKQESPALVSFIQDYELQKPDGAICFMAGVIFNSEKARLKFKSPVHVVSITVKHLDVIYLLNPAIDAARINTMFSNSKKFHYSEKKRFSISGKSRIYGRYTIFIVPISKDCGIKTVAEIRAKTHN